MKIYDHSGRAHNVTLHPGDMLLFESHSVIHGRPFPLKGRYYAMLFIHFEPTGHSLRHGAADGNDIDVDKQYREASKNNVGGQSAHTDTLPPYIIRESPEEIHWRQLHPQGWEKPEFNPLKRSSKSKLHRAAADGDVKTVERALEKTEFDFVDEVARILPMRMLGRLLGVPDEDGELLVDLGDQLLSNSDPEYTDHVVDKVNTEEFRLIPFRSPAGLEVFKYAQNAASERRNSQHQDLITRLLEPTNDGQPLTDLEFNNFFTLLVAAGNDTTRYSLTEGLRALVEHPDEMQKLRDDPKLIESAIEEILRWTTVTTHFRRTATSDLELSGHEIKEGQKVVLWWVSANYDERKFEDPYKFDICRHPNDHVTFGRNGPHLCLGAWLARMELRVTIEELLKRTSKIEITKTSEKLRSHLISGTKHLFVKAT